MIKKRLPAGGAEGGEARQSAVTAVVTHSSGNHAQAVALAGRLCGIPAHIVMPKGSPAVKVQAVRDYGGIITFCENNEQVSALPPSSLLLPLFSLVSASLLSALPPPSSLFFSLLSPSLSPSSLLFLWSSFLSPHAYIGTSPLLVSSVSGQDRSSSSGSGVAWPRSHRCALLQPPGHHGWPGNHLHGDSGAGMCQHSTSCWLGLLSSSGFDSLLFICSSLSLSTSFPLLLCPTMLGSRSRCDSWECECGRVYGWSQCSSQGV